jgi:hypothetical protein
MTDFASALRRIDRRLHVPQPVRSRVILELAGDLEALHGHYLAKGLGETEAREAALADLDASDEVIAALAEVHASPVRRGMDRVVRQMDAPWARGLLLVVLVGGVAAAARAALSPMFVEDAGVFLWPLGVVLMAGLAAGGMLLIRLQRFDADDPARARRAADRLAVLIFVEGTLAGLGSWLELYWAAGRMAEAGGDITVNLFGWGVRTAALLSAGIAASLVLAVVWFFASHRLAVLEDARAALLLTVPELEGRTEEEVGR